jgi:hypothetical protein
MTAGGLEALFFGQARAATVALEAPAIPAKFCSVLLCSAANRTENQAAGMSAVAAAPACAHRDHLQCHARAVAPDPRPDALA